jgi:hypothetical protein
MSGGISFLILPGWGSECLLYLNVTLFLKIQKFSAIMFLNKLSVPLVCISSSFVPMIHSVGLLMLSPRS